MFTVRNAVLIALMQIGVIVAGVLAAGVCNKWWTSVGAIGLPLPTLLLMNYGVAALGIPMLWIIVVLQLRRRPEVSEDAKDLAFLSGIMLLLVFCIFRRACSSLTLVTNRLGDGMKIIFETTTGNRKTQIISSRQAQSEI